MTPTPRPAARSESTGASTQVDATAGPADWVPEVAPLRWVVPSPGLVSTTPDTASNNNVALATYDGRLFMAWRTAPTHFASTRAKMVIASSTDLGTTWRLEHEVALGSDVREPTLFVVNGRAMMTFFQAGT